MPTALIVDDEPEANRLLSLLVQLRGYETASAYTGEQALALARSHPPQVVFLDLMLPDLNGFEVCAELKGRRSTGLIPVVVVTARLADENRIRSAQVGADDFVSKPYTPDQIFEALAAADTRTEAIRRGPASGEFPIDAGDPASVFAGIARLRGLLLDRTHFDEATVRQLGSDLATLAQDLIDWAAPRGLGVIAELRYALAPDRLDLTVQDLVGWCEGEVVPGDRVLGAIRESELLAGADRIAGGRAFHILRRPPVASSS